MIKLSRMINELFEKSYPIIKKSADKLKGADRYYFFFNTDAGFQYRISIVTIPGNFPFEKFIIGKYYPEALKFVREKLKGDPKKLVATLTFAVLVNGEWADKYQTNAGAGEYLKILSTSNDILIKFDKKKKLSVVYFSGAFKTKEIRSISNISRDKNISQRTNITDFLVRRFLASNSNWEKKQFSNLIVLIRKELL